MLQNVDGFVSPDGRRIAMIDRDTGRVWVLEEQDRKEIGVLLAEFARWKPLTRSCVAPAPAQRASGRRRTDLRVMGSQG